MTKRIIYQNDEGGVAIIIPSPEAIALHGIEAVALKDVPAGKPYKVIDASEVPEDRTFRNAWTVEPEFLADGVGADYGAGSLFDVIGYSDGNVIVRHRETGEVSEVKA